MTFDQAVRVLENLCDDYDWFPLMVEDEARLVLGAVGFKQLADEHARYKEALESIVEQDQAHVDIEIATYALSVQYKGTVTP